jgi:predicted RNA binding protein YcfA (HicA-like mRNA interferase family)
VNKRKLLKKALAGGRNLSFRELVALVEAFGFTLARVSGSHHIFEHPGIAELVNIQKRKGKAKPYQVKQFLELVEQYNLTLGDDA